MIYRTRAAAIVFAVGIALLVAFLDTVPLHDAPAWLRFIVLPLVGVYLWATPPPSS